MPSCSRMNGSRLAVSNSSPPTWKDPARLPTTIAVPPTNSAFPATPAATAAGRTTGAVRYATPAAPRAMPAAPSDTAACLPNCSGVCVSSGRACSYTAPMNPPSAISSSRVCGAAYWLRSSSCCWTISVPMSSSALAPPSHPQSETILAPGPAIADPNDFWSSSTPAPRVCSRKPDFLGSA